MKKILSILLVLCALLTLSLPALAVNAGEERAVIGADLNENDILSVYAQFGLTRGSVRELTVTNAEERSYLQGIVDDSVIGTRSISCIYIKTLEQNAGLRVSTNNISWCTQDMYRSALMTAGIYDAEVKVGAPFPVSGTAALTGIYKAYEDITGTHLDEQAKTAAADELVLTAELADALEQAVNSGEVQLDPALVDMAAEELSNADAVAIVNELKLILDQTSTMTDEELRVQIIQIAASYGYTLDEDMINRLIELCRSMEGLSISELTDKVEQFKSTVETVQRYSQTVQEYTEKAAGFGAKVADFFNTVIDFFSGLFGGRG